MTKNEFNSYIDGLNKAPGEYTNEEYYKIGCLHKTLPRNEINWTQLANKVGINKTGEQYRHWIVNRQRRDGTIKRNPNLLTTTIYDISTQELDSKLDEKLDTIYKEQVKNTDKLNAIRRNLRDEARIENIKNLIKTSIDTLPKLELKSLAVKKDTQAEAILMLSDLHLGVKCSNFYNSYDKNIAKLRLEKLVAKVKKYCRVNNVNTLHILNLGDMIAGTIHVNARIEQELNAIDQTITAAELLAQVCNELTTICPNVTYRSVVDNHARITPDKESHIEKENFNRVIDWYLRERLKDTRIVFKDDNLDVGLGKFVLRNGKKIMFSHGHQDNYNQIFQALVGASKEYIDIILMGHFHSTKMKTFQGCKVFINGSIVGTEQYALSKRLFGDPEQTLLIFNENDVEQIILKLN